MVPKVLALALLLSLAGNLYLAKNRPLLPPAATPTPSSQATAYNLLSPRIFAENQNDIIINFMDLRNQLKADVATFPFKVGLYFEYLPSGTSIGINEKDNFAIASLLKVPLVMATYQAVNDGKFTLDQKLTLRQADLDTGFGTLYQRGVGASLSLQEAMRLSLVESDNTAKNVLTNTIPLKYLEDVFDSLDIPKDVAGKMILITPKSYSSILRALYLSSYLPYDQSNQILTWLAETPFDDKIAQPIPKDIKVAHKIGSFEAVNSQDDVFTDCGITYVPRRPYILCVMVNADETKAQNAMSFIAEHAYIYVKNANHLQQNTDNP